MATVAIDFDHGQSEAADAKLLPQGLYKSVVNMRYRKDKRLVSRFGYQYVNAWASPGSGSSVMGSAKFGMARSLHLWTAGTAATSFSSATVRGENGNYSAFMPAITELSGVTRIPIGRNIPGDAGQSDVGYCNGFIFTAVAIVGATKTVSVTATDRNGVQLLFKSFATSMSPRVCVLGNTVAVFYLNTTSSAIDCSLFDATTTPSFTSTTTGIATPNASFKTDFAACAGESGHFGFAYHTGTNLSVGRTTASGSVTYTAVNTIAIGGNTAIPDVGFDGTSTYRVVWTDGTSVNAQSYNSGALIGSPDTIDTTSGGTDAIHMPTIAYLAGLSRFVHCWTKMSPPFFAGSDGATALTPIYVSGMAIVSRPTMIGNVAYAWCVTGGTTVAAGQLIQSDYMLVNLNSGATLATAAPSIPTGAPLTGRAGAVACQREALAPTQLGTDLGNANRDVRRNIATVPAITSNVPYPGVTYYYTALPILDAAGVGCDLIRIDAGRLGAAPASIAFADGRLVIAGPRVSEFDGASVYESGLRFGPDLMTIAETSGGGLSAATTYFYIAVYEWFDALGCRHQSTPSEPVKLTTTTGTAAIVQVSALPITERTNGAQGIYPSKSGVFLSLYRTLGGGRIYYLVTKLSDPTILTRTSALPTDELVTLTDTLADTVIQVNGTLYTQGARGGLSGLLPNDEPPPCRYVWAGRSRVILGGLEQPSDIQFSKLFFHGEPVQYSIEDFYKVRLNGEVTAVFSLDNTFYACTRDAIYQIQGDGPDDNGGGGSFADPVKLPSDVGVLSHRSLVEIPQGILFQATSERIYLLPRGGNSPQWIGQPVRDTLALFPYITSATMNQTENCAYISCTNSAGDAGCMLIYDTRTGEWYVDTFFSRAVSSLCVHNNKLLMDSNIAQTAAWTDDDTGAHSQAITQTVEFGDIRPFGPSGWGRILLAGILGEYRAPTALTIALSYDSGVTFPNSTTLDLTTGFSAGDRFRKDYTVPRPKGDSLHPKLTIVPSSSVGVSAPSEGLAFNSWALEVLPEKSMPRLPAAQRA